MSKWKTEAKEFLKTKMHHSGVTSGELARLTNQLGGKETRASIDNKISRGTFSASFLFKCMHALGAVWPEAAYVRETQAKYVVDNQPDAPINVYSSRNKSYVDISDNRIKPLKNNSVISLFSGAGGLDIGLEMAGFETAVCVEIDADCRETLRHNRPNWRLFEESDNRNPGDIRDIHATEILKKAGLERGEAALVVGGAPCQPFSNIGKKWGRNDPKNGDLFLEFVRIVKGVLPHAFIFENVAGFVQDKHSSVLDYMKEKLKGLGYGISYTILNAADYGVPQRRERFFLIGIRGVESPSFPLPTHSRSGKWWTDFCGTLDMIPHGRVKPWVTLSEVLAGLPKDHRRRPDYVVMNISDFVVERMKRIGPGQNFKVLPMNMRPNCWKNGKHQGQDTFGRLRLDEPTITIRTAAYNPAKGKYIHPIENRGLNSIEMAAIQTFPSSWEFKCVGKEGVTLRSAGMQIGNAVPPLLGRALGLALRAQLTSKTEFFQKRLPLPLGN